MLQVISTTNFDEMTALERCLYEIIDAARLRHQRELAPLYAQLVEIQALRSPKLVIPTSQITTT